MCEQLIAARAGRGKNITEKDISKVGILDFSNLMHCFISGVFNVKFTNFS